MDHLKKENIMNHKKSEKGQALIIIVVAIIGLLAITGLTVDGGRLYADRANAQGNADSAALGAALAKAKNENISSTNLTMQHATPSTTPATAMESTLHSR
jgi:uncharacterized membrane protein